MVLYEVGHKKREKETEREGGKDRDPVEKVDGFITQNWTMALCVPLLMFLTRLPSAKQLLF